MTGRILTALRRPSARAAPRFAGRVGSRVDGRAAPRVGSGVDGRAAPRVGSRVPRLLRERPFRRYWAAQTISLFGDQVSGIAIPLVGVLVLHAGPAQMGCLSAIIWLPFLFFGLHAGAWVDRRGHRRATMIVADLGRALLLGSVPVSYALHVLTLWQLYGVAFGAGTLSVLFEVSDSTLFVAVVDADSYVEGNSLVYGSRAMSFVAGPSVGGLLVQALSAPFAVIADALSFIGSAFILCRIRPDEPPTDGEGKGALAAGARFMLRSGIVRASLLSASTIKPVQLHVLRAVLPIRDPVTTSAARGLGSGHGSGCDRRSDRLRAHAAARGAVRGRLGLRRGLRAVPAAPGPRPAG